VAEAQSLAFQGFETDTGDWTPTTTRVASGGGSLHLTAASGNYYAELTNVDNSYCGVPIDPTCGYGGAEYSYFGFATQPPYTGDYSQSIKMYVFANWPLAIYGGPGVWIDMSPGQPPQTAYNYEGEHNFRLTPTGSSSTGVGVFVDGLPSIATITTSGWYNFQMIYKKGKNPTDPVTTVMNVFDPSGNLIGSITLLDNTYDPSMPTVSGGTLLSQDLQGPGYVWITVWPNGWANDLLAIDDVRADLLGSTTSAGNGAPFQVRYVSNLAVGDSVIDITNDGQSAVADDAPGIITSASNLCVGVYTFDANEELQSCCACLVTPNGLASLSAQAINSTSLTGENPTSLVVKLLAWSTTAGASSTAPPGTPAPPTSSSCNPATPGTLSAGMHAWGTTVHALPTGSPSSYTVTETEFSPALLSAAEYAHITQACEFNQINGSAQSGQCKGCASGGQ